jgi:hypothetical protein
LKNLWRQCGGPRFGTMTNPNKLTRERLETLITKIRYELSGFQLGPFISEPTFGVVDVSLFGLRYKLVDHPVEKDDLHTIFFIVKEEDIKSDDIFLALVSSGYLKWLREQISTHAFLKILTFRDRWSIIVEHAIKQIKEQKKGLYLLNTAKDLQDKPLLQIYHEDPTVFDWLLR